jgi:hypothetical protein
MDSVSDTHRLNCRLLLAQRFLRDDFVADDTRQETINLSLLIAIIITIMLMLMFHSSNYHANIHQLLNVFMLNPSRFWQGSIPSSDSNRCSRAHSSSFARAMIIDRDTHSVTLVRKRMDELVIFDRCRTKHLRTSSEARPFGIT